ncbi:C13 family peptidase [Candidatus Foliamicus sp.]
MALKSIVTTTPAMLVLTGVLASGALATEEEHPEELLPLDVERVYANQERLVQMALDKVRRSEEGVTETYFVGFGSYAAQDVFENEVKLIEAQFREQLGAKGRTAMLINSRNTVDKLPLANGPNLSAVLNGIGRKMGAEDLIVLHITSHGSRRHRISVRFKPFRMKSLSAERIGKIVKDAKLPWQVIVISACYSGGYIDALKSPHTMVITASEARRRSFGCESGRDYTYFGAAFYRDNLFGGDYRAAFERAAVLVRQREESKGYKPSLPQIWVGELIEDKLSRAQGAQPFGN